MTVAEEADFIIIGAGIAGSSVAAELAADGRRVLLVEAEQQPGYHTTGRSAAIFAPTYGPAPIRALTRASEAFFTSPPAGFSDHPLLSHRDILMIARPDQIAALDALIDEVGGYADISRLEVHEVYARQPLLRDGYAVAGMLDAGGHDIDVDALLQGYLRRFRAEGGRLVAGAGASDLRRDAGLWRVNAGGREYAAPVVINAAGAWADEVGALAGAGEIGLVPKRRTAVIIAAPEDVETDHLPLTVDVDEKFYLKPESGRLLISPADETPTPPCDVQPEELDIAICVDKIERAFDLSVRRVENSWAGLRSFVGDKVPVVGFSARAEGFFWLAGQGGYGIQTAPAMARLAAALAQGKQPPADIIDEGLDMAAMSSARLGV
ncbi:MAG: FAD-dependent oxidoreductase [Paracoccaceae bacterium]|nr:FAD-dependent oxidoreductase [Paracoccaceae bacterium]